MIPKLQYLDVSRYKNKVSCLLNNDQVTTIIFFTFQKGENLRAITHSDEGKCNVVFNHFIISFFSFFFIRNETTLLFLDPMNLKVYIFTSIFPVSGAPQLNTCGAQTERPMISQRYPYSRFERPAPNRLDASSERILPTEIRFLALAALSACT